MLDLLDTVERTLLTYLTRLISELTPYSIDVLRAGCPECDGVSSWPADRIIRYVWATLLLVYVAYMARQWPEVTSAYRCAPCNERRGGAERSRHLATDAGGKPHAAYDIQWESSGPARQVWTNRRAVAEGFRSWTGWQGGVGIIIYGRRLHIDIREHDYFGDER